MLARIREIGKGMKRGQTFQGVWRGRERGNKKGNNEFGEGMLVEGWDENLDHISEKRMARL